MTRRVRQLNDLLDLDDLLALALGLGQPFHFIGVLLLSRRAQRTSRFGIRTVSDQQVLEITIQGSFITRPLPPDVAVLRQRRQERVLVLVALVDDARVARGHVFISLP